MFRVLSRSSRHTDEAFPLQVKNNLLGCFLGGQLGRVDGHFSVGWSLIRIGNAGELLDDSCSSFGVQPLAIALLAGFDRGCDMDEDEATVRLNHVPDLFADGIVRSNRCTDGDSPILGNLRGNITDAADINIAVFLGESEFRGEMFAYQIDVENGNGTTSDLQKLRQQDVGNGRLTGT